MLEQHNVYKEREEMDQLYKWILDTKYEDFPAELVSYAKILMLDVLGCIIGGSKEEAIPEVVSFVQEHGGAKESYLPIYGGQYSAAMVGFALGSMARSLDFGDVHMQGSHTSEYVFPTLLAATGLKNKLTGLDLINAFIIGKEVLIRMGIASNWKAAVINQVYLGGHFIFGVIAAVAKLLDLNQKELNNAMGMAIGKIQPHHTPLILKYPSHMVRLHHGFIA
ncbi:MAG: MmgE/PrpD family protein [Atribacterota bacterium]